MARDWTAYWKAYLDKHYPTGIYANKPDNTEHAELIAALRNHSDLRIEWRVDDGADTSWMDAETLAEYERGDIKMLACLVWRDVDGAEPECVWSLWGISVTGYDDPYCKVIEADAAREVL